VALLTVLTTVIAVNLIMRDSTHLKAINHIHFFKEGDYGRFTKKEMIDLGIRLW
jgi:hypothetical protein